jgi:hypothetical protein
MRDPHQGRAVIEILPHSVPLICTSAAECGFHKSLLLGMMNESDAGWMFVL